ncbi:MAG TPA: hypothetical protein VJB08_05360 [Candidatus Nanoarchaeia archaeon]|nr:hypothetical protein [Candidatus Nanoarchaeia archaeon]
MGNVEDYIETVIKSGDTGSALIAQQVAQTLRNSKLVDIIKEGMHGINVLRIPQDYYAAVHSAAGDPKEPNLEKYTASLVDRLVGQAEEMGFQPHGFADVIDIPKIRLDVLAAITGTLKEKADQHGLAILNGELAGLGSRVNGIANSIGTMISIAPKDRYPMAAIPGVFASRTFRYALFDHQGKPVFINADGVGTKVECYERSGSYEKVIHDFDAMTLDDASKLGADPKVVAGVVETRGDIPFGRIAAEAQAVAKELGFLSLLCREDVGDRIRGYSESCYNLSGSVVSTIDEERLAHPLKPSAGESLVAIRGKPNPRSNGITVRRRIMVRLFGEDWHTKEEGKPFLEYLTAPSTILYGVFKDLIDQSLATSVYHMSGGAFEGKLAKPLASHGLFIKLQDLFPPDYRDLALVEAAQLSAEEAYGMWPMGNDGFISTADSDAAIRAIKKYGLEARAVGHLQPAQDGKTGVELIGFHKKHVYFSGRD